MKKKLVVLLVLLTMVCSLVFCSCTFVKENKERVSQTVVSTVTYDYVGNSLFPAQKLSLSISRNELLSYVNYMIYLYSQYQMKYDLNQVVDDSLDSLRLQKYQILKGMEYIMNSSSQQRLDALYYNTPEYKAINGTTITCEGLLTVAERYNAIANSNKSFNDSITTYVDDYFSEVRALAVSSSKEDLASYYKSGYAVAEDGVSVAHLVTDTTDQYADGLYKSHFSSDDKDIDFKQVYIKIKLVKDKSEDKIFYYPINESMMALSDNANKKSANPRLTNRILAINYDEPITVEEKDKETGKITTKKSTKAHKIEVEYSKFTPRTAIPKDDKGNEVVKTIDYLNDTEYNYRYKTTFTATDEEKKFATNGAIFEVAPSNLDAAHKDAYRQFSEAKKAQLIGFDPNEKVYNGLGYFYKSAFESEILSVVNYEVSTAKLATTPITDAAITAQFNNLVKKQKEEYDLLSGMEQVKKFATTVGTNLETCYYIPLDALKNNTYKYKDGAGVEKERPYATLNADGTYTIDIFYITHILFKFDDDFKMIMDRATANITDKDEVKKKKLELIINEGLLTTNISNPDYIDKRGFELKDAYEIVLDKDGNPVLDKNGAQQLVKKTVKAAYEALLAELNTADTDEKKLVVFKKFMTLYNDDGGTMKSELGYVVGMGDIPHSYDGDDFPNTAKNLYIDYISDGAFSKTTDTAFTTYGLHVETISFMPFDKITISDSGKGVYSLGIDKKLDLTGKKTFKDTIKTSLTTTQNTATYQEWTKAISKEDAMSHSVINKKAINDIKKDLKIK